MNVFDLELKKARRRVREAFEWANKFLAVFANDPIGAYNTLTSTPGRASMISARGKQASMAADLIERAEKYEALAAECRKGASAACMVVDRLDKELEATRADYEAAHGGAA